MHYKSFTLDKFQEDSIHSIENNHSVVVSAPTGSGKTLIADYIINKYVKKGIKVIYTAPIKALSNQKYKEFTSEYGKENIGLLTGDVVKNPEAPILIMTTEIYRNMALINDPSIDKVSYVIFDEIHYINDIERGYVWEESIIFSKPHVRFLCLSATIPNSNEFASWISAIKKHNVDVVKHDKRNVPLHKKFYDADLGITDLKNIHELSKIPSYDKVMRKRRKKGQKPKIKTPYHVNLIKEIKDKLPCFFFAFSRKKCQQFALELSKKNMFEINPKITPLIREKLDNSPVEINDLDSTKILRRTLPYGIAFHHAGLIPIIKELVEELFSQGLIKVLYTTETFAVGINMPAKTVCFESMRKFDGITFRQLNSKEYFQIAGRAGRRGIDKEGFVYAMIDRRYFNYEQIKKITLKDIDPIKSQFKLSINTVLNLIKNHNEEEIQKILISNFYTFQKHGENFDKVTKDVIISQFNRSKKRLIKYGYIKDDKLTEKGEFSSRIYADEILTGEIFATKFYEKLNEYQMLMLLACLAYEPRERVKFFKKFPSKFIDDLYKKIDQHDYLYKERRFHYLEALTAMVHPAYHGKTIFDIIENTNLLEGDIIRFFRQIIDRIGQIKNATSDYRLRDFLDNCQKVVVDCLEDIDLI